MKYRCSCCGTWAPDPPVVFAGEHTTPDGREYRAAPNKVGSLCAGCYESEPAPSPPAAGVADSVPEGYVRLWRYDA